MSLPFKKKILAFVKAIKGETNARNKSNTAKWKISNFFSVCLLKRYGGNL